MAATTTSSSSPMPPAETCPAAATMPLQASHLDTRLASPSLPIVLRTITPGDAASMSALLSAPENAADPNARPLTPDRCAANIARQRADASVPSVLDPADPRRVLSGPSRVNMAVVVLSPRQGGTTSAGHGQDDAPLPDGEATAAEEESDETMIGLGGYGAIKNWVRDGKPLRAGDAMRLAIDWAFTPVSAGGPQLDLVTVTTLADNEPMVRLAEDKLGLRGRGVRRPAEHGEPAGELYYELTAEEWKQLRPRV
ncbi:hypothetical protein ACCO45_011347 [Purpureocillium lilacinum]|uniref:Uncharacterized protein n=1 Tax=Purpureocillium lilacinum TaxID=33203 RepID=A0ACC4DJN8_PURLI